MDITAPDQLKVFFTTANTTMWQAYSTTQTVHPQIATEIPMGSEFYTEGWTGMGRIMREWVGPRITETPAPQTYSVQVQLWELTESFDVFKMKDDHLGLLASRPAQLGMNIKKNPDYILRDLIENARTQVGARQKGIDQLTHWNSSHPVDFYDTGKGTFTNDYGSAGTSIGGITVGGTLALNSYITVWQDMAARKSESGEKLGLQPNLAMGPSQLKATFSTILNAQFMGAAVIGNLGTGASPGPNAPFVGATENTFARGTADLLTWLDLTNVAAWYLLVTNRPRKPFTIATREGPQFLFRNSPTDPAVFDQHAFLYGAHERRTPAWAFPWLSSRSGV